MSDDNVITFDPKARPLIRVKPRDYTKPYRPHCQFHGFDMSDDEETVSCRMCKRTFTAYEALLFIARHWTNYHAEVMRIQGELRELHAERDTLDREVKSLKAAGRRLGGGESALKKQREEIEFLRQRCASLEHRYEQIPPHIKRMITKEWRAKHAAGGGGS